MLAWKFNKIPNSSFRPWGCNCLIHGDEVYKDVTVLERILDHKFLLLSWYHCNAIQPLAITPIDARDSNLDGMLSNESALWMVDYIASNNGNPFSSVK